MYSHAPRLPWMPNELIPTRQIPCALVRYLCYTYSMEWEPTRFQTLSVITDTEGETMKYGATAMGLGFGLAAIVSVYTVLYPTLVTAMQVAA